MNKYSSIKKGLNNYSYSFRLSYHIVQLLRMRLLVKWFYSCLLQSDLLTAADVINWNRRILGLVGCWPEDSKHFLFSFILGYLVIHTVCECTYLFKNIRKLEYIISSLTEVIPFTAAILKSILIQKHKNILCKIIHHVKKNFNDGGNRSDEEVRVSNEYITMAKNFIRVVPPMIFLTSLIYFAKPFFSEFANTSKRYRDSFVCRTNFK